MTGKNSCKIYTGIIAWQAMAIWLLQPAMIYIKLQESSKN